MLGHVGIEVTNRMRGTIRESADWHHVVIAGAVRSLDVLLLCLCTNGHSSLIFETRLRHDLLVLLLLERRHDPCLLHAAEIFLISYAIVRIDPRPRDMFLDAYHVEVGRMRASTIRCGERSFLNDQNRIRPLEDVTYVAARLINHSLLVHRIILMKRANTPGSRHHRVFSCIG